MLNYIKTILAFLLVGLGGCSYLQQPAAPVSSGSATVVSGSTVELNSPSYSAQTTPINTNTTVKPVGKNIPSAPKEETHTVQAGENLYRIALANDLKYQDVAKWNNLTDFSVRVGQVLRLTPPTSIDTSVNNNAKSNTEKTETEAQSKSSIDWTWPTKGKVTQGFSDKNKGLDISGKAGQAVVAAASGTVAYSGSGLRGYGKLIIIKHDKTYLSAYAHNRTLLVKEGAVVKKGQKIAEMGDTDANQVMLHFEIRRFGKPEDPAKYLK